jgi:multicomponent Na+:H+ antiporter subunit E
MGKTVRESAFRQPVPRSFRFRVTAQLLVFALLWRALAGDGGESWLFGTVAVAGAVALSRFLAWPTAARISFFGALRFLPFFLRHSVAGGLDVARRAADPRMPLAPDLLDYDLRLPPGSARVFLVDTVSLLPGTLSADLVDDRLLIHVLDRTQPNREKLRALENAVARVFSMDPASDREGKGSGDD